MIVFTQSNEQQYFMLSQSGNCWQGKPLVILSTAAKKPLCIISLDLMNQNAQYLNKYKSTQKFKMTKVAHTNIK